MDEQKPRPLYELGGTLFINGKLYSIPAPLMSSMFVPLPPVPLAASGTWGQIYGVRTLKTGERLGVAPFDAPQRRDSDERLVEPSVAAYLEDWFTR